MMAALLIRGNQTRPRRRHLLLRIDRCTHHYQQRGYLHDTGATCMLMTPPVCCRHRCCRDASIAGWRVGQGGKREQRGDKERVNAGTLQRVEV